MRKILKNNRKTNRLTGTSKGKIGVTLPIRDRYGNVMNVGDKVQYGEYTGMLLYNQHEDCYGVALDYSMWHGEDRYNIDSYGKFIAIPMDNGARMEIEKLE